MLTNTTGTDNIQHAGENQIQEYVRRIELLEEALAEYAQQFGLSEKARTAFSMPHESEAE